MKLRKSKVGITDSIATENKKQKPIKKVFRKSKKTKNFEKDSEPSESFKSSTSVSCFLAGILWILKVLRLRKKNRVTTSAKEFESVSNTAAPKSEEFMIDKNEFRSLQPNDIAKLLISEKTDVESTQQLMDIQKTSPEILGACISSSSNVFRQSNAGEKLENLLVPEGRVMEYRRLRTNVLNSASNIKQLARSRAAKSLKVSRPVLINSDELANNVKSVALHYNISSQDLVYLHATFVDSKFEAMVLFRPGYEFEELDQGMVTYRPEPRLELIDLDDINDDFESTFQDSSCTDLCLINRQTIKPDSSFVSAAKLHLLKMDSEDERSDSKSKIISQVNHMPKLSELCLLIISKTVANCGNDTLNLAKSINNCNFPSITKGDSGPTCQDSDCMDLGLTNRQIEKPKPMEILVAKQDLSCTDSESESSESKSEKILQINEVPKLSELCLLIINETVADYGSNASNMRTPIYIDNFPLITKDNSGPTSPDSAYMDLGNKQIEKPKSVYKEISLAKLDLSLTESDDKRSEFKSEMNLLVNVVPKLSELCLSITNKAVADCGSEAFELTKSIDIGNTPSITKATVGDLKINPQSMLFSSPKIDSTFNVGNAVTSELTPKQTPAQITSELRVECKTSELQLPGSSAQQFTGDAEPLAAEVIQANTSENKETHEYLSFSLQTESELKECEDQVQSKRSLAESDVCHRVDQSGHLDNDEIKQNINNAGSSQSFPLRSDHEVSRKMFLENEIADGNVAPVVLSTPKSRPNKQVSENHSTTELRDSNLEPIPLDQNSENIQLNKEGNNIELETLKNQNLENHKKPEMISQTNEVPKLSELCLPIINKTVADCGSNTFDLTKPINVGDFPSITKATIGDMKNNSSSNLSCSPVIKPTFGIGNAVMCGPIPKQIPMQMTSKLQEGCTTSDLQPGNDSSKSLINDSILKLHRKEQKTVTFNNHPEIREIGSSYNNNDDKNIGKYKPESRVYGYEGRKQRSKINEFVDNKTKEQYFPEIPRRFYRKDNCVPEKPKTRKLGVYTKRARVQFCNKMEILKGDIPNSSNRIRSSKLMMEKIDEEVEIDEEIAEDIDGQEADQAEEKHLLDLANCERRILRVKDHQIGGRRFKRSQNESKDDSKKEQKKNTELKKQIFPILFDNKDDDAEIDELYVHEEIPSVKRCWFNQINKPTNDGNRLLSIAECCDNAELKLSDSYTVIRKRQISGGNADKDLKSAQRRSPPVKNTPENTPNVSAGNKRGARLWRSTRYYKDLDKEEYGAGQLTKGKYFDKKGRKIETNDGIKADLTL